MFGAVNPSVRLSGPDRTGSDRFVMSGSFIFMSFTGPDWINLSDLSFLSGYQPCNAVQALENSPIPSDWAASASAQSSVNQYASPGVELRDVP